MNCCIEELCNKDVINIENGSRIGFVCDVEVDISTGQISALTVAGNSKNISFKKPDCLKICWSDIVVMGEETILVKNVPQCCVEAKEQKRIFDIFSK